MVGRGAGVTFIDALRGDRAFDVFPNSSVSLESLTVSRGRSGPGGPGGAIRNQGTLTVLRVAFEDNAAGAGADRASIDTPIEPGGAGGAIWSGGPASPSVIVSESTFAGNAAGRGGAGFSGPTSASGGAAGGAGGAIAVVSGTADVAGSTFAGNRAGDGGPGGATAGIQLAGGDGGSGGALTASGGATVTVVNSTFAGNAAGAAGTPVRGYMRDALGGAGGGAHLDGGSLRVAWSTFAGNARGADADAGAANGVQGGQVSASILAEAAPACGGLTPAALLNVLLPGDRSCPGPSAAGDPRLGTLAANGGPTPTLLPGPGSAAIDALVGAPCPGTDQRGLPRPRLGGCDAGAVEVQPTEPGAVGRPGGPAASTTRAAAAARRVSALSLSPSRFRAAKSGASVGRAGAKALQQRAPIGTTVRYALDGAARVTFTVTKKAAGRRKGRRCVRPAAARPGARRCLRTQRLKGSFAHQGAAGQNSFRFTGRLRRKALRPGPYTLVATLPKPPRGRAARTSRAFRIVR